MCREVQYGQHPDVAYKLMEIRQKRASCSGLPGGLADPRCIATLAKGVRTAEGIYERPPLELESTAMPPTKCDCERNCQGCLYDKEACYLFDLIRHEEGPRMPPDTIQTIPEEPIPVTGTEMETFKRWKQ